MRVKYSAAIFAVLAVIGASRLVVRAQQAAPATRSVSDGVYTADQAKRGQAVYSEQCAHCHGPRLEGGQSWEPPLAGGQFLTEWAGKPVGDLFQLTSTTMPADKTDPLTSEQTADVTAYILSENKAPAGDTELSHDSEALKSIVFPTTVPSGI